MIGLDTNVLVRYLAQDDPNSEAISIVPKWPLGCHFLLGRLLQSYSPSFRFGRDSAVGVRDAIASFNTTAQAQARDRGNVGLLTIVKPTEPIEVNLRCSLAETWRQLCSGACVETDSDAKRL